MGLNGVNMFQQSLVSQRWLPWATLTSLSNCRSEMGTVTLVLIWTNDWLKSQIRRKVDFWTWFKCFYFEQTNVMIRYAISTSDSWKVNLRTDKILFLRDPSLTSVAQSHSHIYCQDKLGWGTNHQSIGISTTFAVFIENCIFNRSSKGLRPSS